MTKPDVKTAKILRTARNQDRLVREGGLMLLEVISSLSIFAIMVLSVSVTLVGGMEHRQESYRTYLAMKALRNKIADVQATANKSQNLALLEGIGSVYKKYHGNSYTVPELQSGLISVTCYADENTVPSLLGGARDLNFDGDALDALGGSGEGTDLKLVPIIFTITYIEDDGATRTQSLHRLVAMTTDQDAVQAAGEEVE